MHTIPKLNKARSIPLHLYVDPDLAPEKEREVAEVVAEAGEKQHRVCMMTFLLVLLKMFNRKRLRMKCMDLEFINTQLYCI